MGNIPGRNTVRYSTIQTTYSTQYSDYIGCEGRVKMKGKGKVKVKQLGSLVTKTT